MADVIFNRLKHQLLSAGVSAASDTIKVALAAAVALTLALRL